MHERGVIFGDDVACQLQQLLIHKLATLHPPKDTRSVIACVSCIGGLESVEVSKAGAVQELFIRSMA